MFASDEREAWPREVEEAEELRQAEELSRLVDPVESALPRSHSRDGGDLYSPCWYFLLRVKAQFAGIRSFLSFAGRTLAVKW